MFARDGSSPSNDLSEEVVERTLNLLGLLGLLILGNHDIGMDIPVAGMAEAGDRESGFSLQALGLAFVIDQAPARDDDILIEFYEARCLE